MKIPEARKIIDRISENPEGIYKTDHFLRELDEDGLDMNDVYKILDDGKIERPPVFNAKYRNHEVRLVGETGDGRQACLLIGIRRSGRNRFITMMALE